jgi:Bifunctional DNA primase/polymerase, N-terminal/AAA domain
MSNVFKSRKHKLAARYAEMGVHVFPLIPNDKRPFKKGGYKIATTDRSKIDGWWTENPDANIGASPSASGHCVVDIDVKNNVDGEASWEAIRKRHGAEINTLGISTPSGGRHLWFEGDLPSTASKLGRGIDTRGDGGYVLMPGSTIDGKTYSGDFELDAIAKLPDWVKREASKGGGRSPKKPNANKVNPEPQIASDLRGNPHLIDQPQNIRRAKCYLENLVGFGDVAIEGSGGNDRTYAVGDTLHSLGVSEQKAIDLVLKHWNPSCEPPWTKEELLDRSRSPILNAYRYGGNKGGCFAIRDMSNVFKGIKRKSGILFHSFDELLDREVGPVEELVAGYFEKGIPTFLNGRGGTNKSRLALQVGLSVAAGVSVFGKKVEQASFVYLSSEDNFDEVTRRAQSISSVLKLDRPLLGEYCDRSNMDNALAIVREGGTFELTQFYHQVFEKLKATAGHKFVVLDSCYDFVSFVGKAKVDEGSVNAFIKQVLGGLCVETDSTLCVIWHPSQSGEDRGDAGGWSVAWHNSPRAKLSIKAVKGSPDAFEFKVEKRNHGRKLDPIYLHYVGGALVPQSELDDGERQNRLVRVVAEVAKMSAERSEPINKIRRFDSWEMSEIEKRLGSRPTNKEARAALSHASGQGLVRFLKGTRHRSAGYYPPDVGRAEDLAKDAKQAIATVAK